MGMRSFGEIQNDNAGTPLALSLVLQQVVASIDEYHAHTGTREEAELLGNVVSEVYHLASARLCVTEEEILANTDSIQLVKDFLIQHIQFIRKNITRFYSYNRIIDCVLDFTPESMRRAEKYKIQADYAARVSNRGKISIVVPVYNVENFLEKCIESIVTQTYSNIEVILVDDGSTDYCGDICDTYARMDQRIKVIHKENGGLCSARNAGVREATGDYIGFVDSDDWCLPDMFEYLLNGLLNNGAQVASCRYFRVRDGKISSKANGEDVLFGTHQAIMDEFINHFVIRSTFWNKLFRKELFDGKSFPEGRTYEGTYFMHEVLENVDRLILLGQAKYYYVDNESSIIRTRSFKNGMNYVYSYIKRYNDLSDKHPHLSDKLFDDVINAIRSLTYIGHKASEEEILEKADDVQVMRDFIETHKARMAPLSASVKKEIFALGEGTHSGFKRARVIRGLTNKLSKFFTILTRKKLKIKTKISKGAPKKSKSYLDAPELSAANVEVLRELQSTITEIICEIDRICTKYGLRYYMYGGTLLGAARHKGFIPWDDDADLVMPREDYEKFAKVCQEEFGDKYVYENCFTTPDFHMLFAKVCKRGTYVHEKKWKDKDMHKGIFVDILPLDHFPKSKFWGSVVLHSVSILHQICAFKHCKSKNPIARIMFKLGKKLPRSFIYKLRDFVLKASNRWSSKENICSLGSHYQPMIRRVFKTDWFFGEEKRMEFEGHMFRVPTNWEGYILHLFGPDYMQLPPMEMRVCHSDLTRLNFNGETPPEKRRDMLKYY